MNLIKRPWIHCVTYNKAALISSKHVLLMRRRKPQFRDICFSTCNLRDHSPVMIITSWAVIHQLYQPKHAQHPPLVQHFPLNIQCHSYRYIFASRSHTLPCARTCVAALWPLQDFKKLSNVTSFSPEPANMSFHEGSSDEPSILPETGERPKCSRCNHARSNDWINWQKCWSEPATGADGHPHVLVFPKEGGPIALRMHGVGSFGDRDFWWFFICSTCLMTGPG